MITIKKGKLLLSYRHTSIPEWESFKDGLTTVMDNINPSHNWESPTYPRDRVDLIGEPYQNTEQVPKNPLGFKFRLIDADSFFMHIHPEIYDKHPPFPEFVDVYEYGKQGLYFEYPPFVRILGSHIIVAACKKYFYRDWDRDGICIEIQKTHPKTDEDEVSAAEDEYERRISEAMRRNIEDAENRGGWPYEL